MKKTLLELREESHMTQQQLADATGINRVKLSKYECNHGKPCLDNAIKIAEALGTQVEKIRW